MTGEVSSTDKQIEGLSAILFSREFPSVPRRSTAVERNPFRVRTRNCFQRYTHNFRSPCNLQSESSRVFRRCWNRAIETTFGDMLRGGVNSR